MNREIKFRAYHIAEEKMCDVQLLSFSTNGAFLIGVLPSPDQIINGGKQVVISPTDGRFCDMSEFHLMQYTGLKDKNGKEIYEGDIVKARKGEQEKNSHYEIVDKVYFSCGSFKLFGSPMNEFYVKIPEREIVDLKIKWSGANGGRDIYEEIIDIEVIGNEYENPELLFEK